MGEAQGALPLDPSRDAVPAPCKGQSPLDPFSRLHWLHFHASSACLSTGYPHVPLLPYLRQKAINIGKNPLATPTTSLQGGATTLKPTQRIGAMLLISSMLLTGVSVAEEPSNPPAATEALATAAPPEAPTATPAQEQPTEQSADVPTATPDNHNCDVAGGALVHIVSWRLSAAGRTRL